MTVLLIIEGSDRSGKTQLARAVHDRIKELHPGDRVELLHAGPPRRHSLDEYVHPLTTYRPMQARHIICDRWHVGESVYPALFSRSTTLTPAVKMYVDSFLRSRGALLVHVSADDNTLRRRLADEETDQPGSSMVSWSQLLTSKNAFASEAMTTSLCMIDIDTSGSSTGEYDARSIVEAASQLEFSAFDISELRTYVGGPSPRLLLVGDVRHGHRNAHTSDSALRAAQLDPSPAFMPYPGTSGAFLFEALVKTRLRSRFGVMNANDVDGVHEAWKALGEPRVVALGQRALHVVRDVAVGAVPHPQYVRRFFSKHSAWYGNLIVMAATGANLTSERPTGTWIDRSSDQ